MSGLALNVESVGSAPKRKTVKVGNWQICFSTVSSTLSTDRVSTHVKLRRNKETAFVSATDTSLRSDRIATVFSAEYLRAAVVRKEIAGGQDVAKDSSVIPGRRKRWM
jgi:hypothetical protein